MLVKFQLIELSRSPSAAYNSFHCTGTLKITRATLSLENSPGSETINAVMGHHVNLLKMKRGLLYLKVQFIPHCKHFSSQL
jgi:hypothetical protein